VAEFQEVMRQWSRMCELHDDGCASCDIYVDCGAKYPESRTSLNIKTIEDTVINWAKDHPEPVYPTWEMYLAERMTADMRDGKTHNPQSVEEYVRRTRIPADIAKKLGLKPKGE